MLWNDKSATTVWDSLQEAKARANAAYVRHVSMLVDFYDGDHSSWMEGAGDPLSWDDEVGCYTGYFKQFFPNAWDDGNGNVLGQYLPLARRVIDASATLFHRPPKLILQRAGKDLPTDSAQVALWERLQRDMELAPTCKDWQRRTRLCKTTLAYVNWSFGRMALEVLTPDTFWVYENEYAPSRLYLADLIMHELSQPINSSESKDGRKFVVWERGYKPGQWTVRVTDIFGKALVNPLFPSNVNSYDTYPYVIAHDGQPRGGIYADLDDSLLYGQLGLDLVWTDTHLAMRTEHGGQFWLKTVGGASKLPKELVRGRDRTMVLTGEEDACGYAGSTFNVDGSLAYIDTYLRTMAVMHGLHPDLFAVSGEAFSKAITAVAKAMDRLDLQETRQDQEAYWELRLHELWRRIRTVWNAHNPALAFDGDLELRVEWSDPENSAIDPLTREQSNQAKINTNRTTPAHLLAQEEDIPLEEARKRVLENAAFNAKVREASGGQGLRQTPQSATQYQGEEDGDVA